MFIIYLHNIKFNQKNKVTGLNSYNQIKNNDAIKLFLKLYIFSDALYLR
jgi:hypothetical protein